MPKSFDLWIWQFLEEFQVMKITNKPINSELIEIQVQ